MEVISADPFAMFDPVSGYYYCYATGDDGHNHFLIHKTKDLIHYEFVGYAYNDLDENNWGREWYWAPECYFNPNNKLYYIFYSAKVNYDLVEKYFLDKDYDECCKLGVMTSTSPCGPFKNITNSPMDFSPFDDTVPYLDKITNKPFEVRGEAKDCPKGVYVPAIDADLYFDNNRIFLFFSRCCYLNYVFDKKLNKYIEESNISCVELNTDFWFDKTGKTMPTIKEKYVNVVDGHRKDKFTNIINYNSDPQDWENAHVNDYENTDGRCNSRRWSEGSMVIKHMDEYYIFYSCNCFVNKFYGVGVAKSKSIDGPYVKIKENPVIKQIPEFPLYSTGHGSIVEMKGDHYYVFHGRESNDHIRTVYMGKINFINGSVTVTDIHKGELIK